MHSSLKFSVNLHNDCENGMDMFIDTTLPSGIYVDIFEIKDTSGSSCPVISFHTEDNSIDYESVAHDSGESTKFGAEIFGLTELDSKSISNKNLGCLCWLSQGCVNDGLVGTVQLHCNIPVHLRYFNPNRTCSMHEYKIEEPKIFTRCADRSDNAVAKHGDRDTAWRYTTTLLGAHGNALPYDQRIYTSTGYIQSNLADDNLIMNSPRLLMPVGCLGDLDHVLLQTLGTVVASTFLLFLLLCWKLSMRT